MRFFIYIKKLYSITFNYATPINLSYLWNFGSLALFFLIIQIITGLCLSWYYIAQVDLAFNSVEYIMREVNYGWLIRYLHSNGASFFFLVIYLHIARSVLYGSFQRPRIFVWWSGILIFIIMILTAFLGYVLPWGQMSFWAATVITSLVTAIPYIGTDLVMIIWGGFGIGQQTLTRFYSFHFVLPFVIVFLVIVHLILLHIPGSSNPIYFSFDSEIEDKIVFHPYYTLKDLVGIFFILFFYFLFVFFYPNYLGHPLNYIPANPGITPPHIVPEWYFSPFYGILRAIPNKLFGVILMLSSILILAFCPLFSFKNVRSLNWSLLYNIMVYIFFVNFIMLGWVGKQVLEYPFIELSQIFTFIYFFWFLLLYLIIFWYNFVELIKTIMK